MTKNKQSIMITVDRDLINKLNSWSKSTMVPKSTIINKLLKDFLEKQEVNEEK